MILLAETILYMFIAAFGAAIFSFLNVVIYRTPKKISFVKGFSACPSCGHRLAGYDMVPVFSWIFLRGKCRYCKAPVSVRYTIMELLGAVFAVGTFCLFPDFKQMLLVYFVLCVLAVAAGIDMDTMEIPDLVHILILAAGIAAVFLMPQITLPERLIGAVCISVPMFLLVLLVPGGFGGGDIKLMAAAGFFLGFKLTLFAFFAAVVLGGGYGAWLLLTKKKGKKEHFAFGPFLSAGIAVSLFFGNAVINWYLGFLPI